MPVFALSVKSNRLIRIGLLSGIVLLALGPSVSGQGRKSDYERAKTYSSRVRNLVFRDAVKPNWFDAGRKFWYRVQTGTDSFEYVLVDADAGKRKLVFDHEQVSEVLSSQLERKVDVTKVRLAGFTIAADAKSCSFQYGGRSWSLTLPGAEVISAIKSQDTGGTEGLPSESRLVRSNSQGERTPIRFANRLPTTLEVFWVR